MSKMSFKAKTNCVKGVSVCSYRPTERERTERLIKMRLREIMMQKDLENVTCKEVRHSEICIWYFLFTQMRVLACIYLPLLHEHNKSGSTLTVLV